MKKILLSLVFMMAASTGANAMSFSRAQAEALYLTDKMAYELNLNDQQYNDAYEINLDYFLSIDSPADVSGIYYDHRLNDFRCILYDWQYSLLFATDYFLRPILWRASGWYFPVYSYYNRDYFYYGRPSVWVSYRGGHSHYYHHAGYYANRRPVWNGGLRGRDMHRASHNSHLRSGAGMAGRGGSMSHGRGNSYRGSSMSHGSSNGYRGGGMSHGSSNGYRSGGSGYSSGGRGSMGRGNSFDGSSSRMGHSSGGSGMSRGGGFGMGHSGGGSSSMGRGSGGGSGMGRSGSSGMSRSGGSGMSRSGGSHGGRR